MTKLKHFLNMAFLTLSWVNLCLHLFPRFPATRSYADPVQGFEDQSGNASPAAETPTGISNGKQQAPKKSG